MILEVRGVELQVFDPLLAVLQNYACVDRAYTENELGLCLLHSLPKCSGERQQL